MATKVLRYFFLFLIVFSFAGCPGKKHDETPPVYTMSAIIAGFKWNQNSVTSTMLIDTTHSARVLDITASSGGKTILIEVYNIGSGSSIATGTYAHPTAYFSYSVSGGPHYTTTTGWVSIDDVNTSARTVSGTFDFTVQDGAATPTTIRISDGKIVNAPYSVKYQ